MKQATVRTTLAADSGCAHDPKSIISVARALACAALLFAMAPLAAAPVPVPEILHYTFDEAGTTVTNHASAPPAGTATATILGSTYAQGAIFTPIADALTAPGTTSSSTDYVNTGWATSLDSNSSWTISLFSSEVPASSTLFYIFGDAGANSLRCFTNGVAGAGNYILRGTGLTDVPVNGAADGGSHMLTFVYDQPNSQILAYKDGVLANTVVQGAFSFVGPGPFKVGGYATNVGLAGKMADFRLYSHALTADEILNIYTFITTDTPLTVDITAHTDVSCHGGTDGSLTATPTGGIAPFAYAWSPSGGTAATESNLAAGNYTVAVTDDFGLNANASAEITEPDAIVFTTTALPDGYGLVPYSTGISASGGTGTITYAVTNGTLPPGLALASDGTLSGTPTTLGTYAFTVGATDANTCLVEQALTLNIVVDPADFIFVDGFDGP